jgi:hypothetical protein
MVEWYELLKKQRGEMGRLMAEEGVKARYARIELPLGTAQSNKEMHLVGDYIGVVSITGSGTVKVRLDHRHSQEIDLREVSEISAVFGKLYFTSDGAGGTCTLYIGGALSARLKPIQGKVSIRDISGSDVDLLTEETFLEKYESHTGGHEKTTLASADTAERIVAAALKVKWAIIHTDKEIRYGFTSTVARATAIGAVLAGDSSLVVEYCDLRTLYFVNNVAVETPVLNIEYMEEA